MFVVSPGTGSGHGPHRKCPFWAAMFVVLQEQEVTRPWGRAGSALNLQPPGLFFEVRTGTQDTFPTVGFLEIDGFSPSDSVSLLFHVQAGDVATGTVEIRPPLPPEGRDPRRAPPPPPGSPTLWDPRSGTSNLVTPRFRQGVWGTDEHVPAQPPARPHTGKDKRRISSPVPTESADPAAQTPGREVSGRKVVCINKTTSADVG
ncbi:uncharacterized protein LOC119805915 [Arvicola amphibius]|uniref:uncharacterized protein LOC119805915 n=1 Tax=Arvicola amphibius TaxID=1047088 RepID=UPI0018E3B7CC|nr:uncharacterized protein LOC119805915 [Arvicola amphibius]